MSCAFCQIAAGEREAQVVLESQVAIAFLDHRPLFPGHVLLAPRQHCVTVDELPAASLAPFFADLQRLARAVEAGVEGAEGTLVAINNKVSQSVPHLHVHIVPRRKGDGLKGFFWPRHPYADEGHRDRIAARIRAVLADANA